MSTIDRRRRRGIAEIPLLKSFPWRLDMPRSNTPEYRQKYSKIKKFVRKEEKTNGYVEEDTLAGFLKKMGVLF